MQNTFSDEIKKYDWDKVADEIQSATLFDVDRVLKKDRISLDDFKVLLSPAAESRLEEMAQMSLRLTRQRFGNTIQFYVPVYLSNECNNICTYCGFSLDVDITRKTLNEEEIRKEFEIVKSKGFDHVLLVTGESQKTVGVDYFEHALEIASEYFSHIAIEVQPLDTDDYSRLLNKGLNTVLVYQETYRKDTYKIHHPKGRKSNFDYRVQTHDRLGQAGVHKMGVGVLYGLEDWRTDTWFCAAHLNYLERTHWQSKYSISFPRLRPCAGGVDLKSVLTDKQLVQVICAYRIFNQEVELSLSTRESKVFRDNVIPLGITSISAESKTNPGGYSSTESLEQFEIDDARSVDEMSEVIRSCGLEPVFKDWDLSLQ